MSIPDRHRRVVYGILKHLQKQLEQGVVQGENAEGVGSALLAWFPVQLPSAPGTRLVCYKLLTLVATIMYRGRDVATIPYPL